jgi:uncharacterized protein (TIGR00255 family)
MAIKSMTGYGGATATAGEDRWNIEIRAVNHRHLDLKTRLPRELSAFESRVRELVTSRIGRGHVAVAVSPGDVADAPRTVQVDLPFARRIHAALTELRGSLGLTDEIRLEHLLSFEGVAVATARAVDLALVGERVEAALLAALDAMDAMRRAEGTRLEADIRGRVAALRAFCGVVRAEVPEMLAAARTRLGEKIAALAAGMEPDWQRERLEVEVAMFADRADVTEELTRLDAHLDAVTELLDDGDREPCGRKLEFLAIELNRELNTIGSKVSSTRISRLVVDAKAEVERVREQVANIE